METLNTENKTVRIENIILAYLNKTSKHVFVTETGNFYKIIPYKKDEVWHCLTIEFNGEKIYTNSIDINTMIKYYGNNTKNVIEKTIFPRYNKRTSIPNFKEMKNKMFEVYKLLSTTTDLTKATIPLLGLEVKR